MGSLSTSAALAAALALSLPATAHEAKYAAPLLGASEVPASNSPGSGKAEVEIDFDTLMMTVEIEFQGLVGTTTAAHIHCCTAPGSNTIPATQVPSFSGFPLGVTSGSYEHTFNLADAGSYNPAFIAANGGTVSGAFNAFVTGLDKGQAYLNIHTSSFRGGELRALLALVPAPVPEPATWALLAGGLGVIAGCRRRVAARG